MPKLRTQQTSLKVASETKSSVALANFEVDPVRVERNLTQMGFFGSHDPRNKQSQRRFEQVVIRDGREVTIVAEYETPLRLGVPSTVDQDKMFVFMKLADEQKNRDGVLTNPIRFTGARMLRELRLSDAGKNYAAIDTWCDRMKQTTIRSEMAFYFSNIRKSGNRSIGVFRSYQRIGEEAATPRKGRKDRKDEYEVVVEDWLLENLNSNYVLIEDFSTYLQLNRPIAKGLFGLLFVWFRASEGRKVEKDHNNLCSLLNIKAYTQRSKIEANLGKALDELISIGYLSVWELALMTSKDGYKINMWPGEKLLSFLRAHNTKALPTKNTFKVIEASVDGNRPPALSDTQQQSLKALIDYGVSAPKAEQLARSADLGYILDQIEYVDSLLHPSHKRKIGNPPGLLISFLESNVPLPPRFVSSRKQTAEAVATEAKQRALDIEAAAAYTRKVEYETWVAKQVDSLLERNYPGPLLSAKLKNVAELQSRQDPKFARIPSQYRDEVALTFLRKELQESLALPTCEDWSKSKLQYDLFS